MNILSFSKFYRNFIFLIFTMSTLFGLSSCSAGNSDSQTDSMADTSVSQTHNHQSGGHYMGSSYDRVKQEVRDINFWCQTTSQELEAAKDLAKAGILNIDTIHEKDGKFTGAVVEFAGVKFGMNRGFIFITSRHDKAAVKSLVKTISKYYGEPDEIQGDESEPEYCYYIWDSPNAPYIRIRPLHSEEGGLTMQWGI